jgi:hypothetical protein
MWYWRKGRERAIKFLLDKGRHCEVKDLRLVESVQKKRRILMVD